MKSTIFVIACYNKNRDYIVIEKDNEIFRKMKNNIKSKLYIDFEELEDSNELEYE